MGKTVITQIVDDLDGSMGGETITFSYRGTNYEIDLGRKNANAFVKTMKPYVDAARKISLRGGGRRGSGPGPERSQRAQPFRSRLGLYPILGA